MGYNHKKIVIDGMNFRIDHFPARVSMKLEKRTTAFVAPLTGILKGVNFSKGLDSEIDLSLIGEAIKSVLDNLTESEFEDYIMDMIENTFYLEKTERGKEVPKYLNNQGIFDEVFAGKNLSVYKLLFEIMKWNGFSFLALVGGGGNIAGMLKKLMPTEKN